MRPKGFATAQFVAITQSLNRSVVVQAPRFYSAGGAKRKMKNVIDRGNSFPAATRKGMPGEFFSGRNTERHALVFNFRCLKTAVAGGVLLPGDMQRPVAHFISMSADTGRGQMGWFAAAQ